MNESQVHCKQELKCDGKISQEVGHFQKSAILKGNAKTREADYEMIRSYTSASEYVANAKAKNAIKVRNDCEKATEGFSPRKKGLSVTRP